MAGALPWTLTSPQVKQIMDDENKINIDLRINEIAKYP